ncbi:MAG: DNA replication and repair protein RecF [Bacteroidota bacterium]|nr:DNA replication and repair protein RecF [Bacteroidota bacterium]
MRARSLILTNFRNHLRTEIADFTPGINVISGQNGAGKTSILEALSVAALTKSFTEAADNTLVQTGAENFSLDAQFLSDLGVGLRSKVEYHLGPPARKSIHVNNDKLRRASDLIGRIPIVALTPDDKVITGGSPEERRRFLSLVLSQSSRLYLEDEIEFRKALRHRNSLLGNLREQGTSIARASALLAPWTEVVIERSARIMSRRATFIKEFSPFLLESYELVSGASESPSLRYAPMGFEHDAESAHQLRAFLEEEHNRREQEELKRGMTLIGAHRDELVILIAPEREAKRFASQGQHKSLLVAMKLAEFSYLRDATNETPILLLDDVFSELDAARSHRLLQLIASGRFGQTFISSTTRENFDEMIDFSSNQHRLFVVASGKIETR